MDLFPNSVWEHTYAKLCFARSWESVCDSQNRVLQVCVPKGALGTRSTDARRPIGSPAISSHAIRDSSITLPRYRSSALTDEPLRAPPRDLYASVLSREEGGAPAGVMPHNVSNARARPDAGEPFSRPETRGSSSRPVVHSTTGLVRTGRQYGSLLRSHAGGCRFYKPRENVSATRRADLTLFAGRR